MKPRYHIGLSVLCTLVAYQSWHRFSYLIDLYPDRQTELEVAYTNFWMLCMAIAWVLITKGVLGYTKGKRGDFHLAQFFYGLAITNLADELFFSPLEITGAEYLGFVISAYLALTNYWDVAPIEKGYSWIYVQLKKLPRKLWSRKI